MSMLSQRFDAMDADRSGEVSRDEFVAEAMRAYEAGQARMVDSDSDASDDPSVVCYRHPYPM